jgi:hypothetical protein
VRFAGNRQLIWLFMTWLGVAFICATALYLAEEGVNPNMSEPVDALWWGVVTLTTVGYGDIYPVTLEGRIAAGALMILGITLFAAITATITSRILAEEGTASEDGSTGLLRQLALLHADGVLTDEELSAKKAEVLARLQHPHHHHIVCVWQRTGPSTKMMEWTAGALLQTSRT